MEAIFFAGGDPFAPAVPALFGELFGELGSAAARGRAGGRRCRGDAKWGKNITNLNIKHSEKTKTILSYLSETWYKVRY
jgi:hypothetical protein